MKSNPTKRGQARKEQIFRKGNFDGYRLGVDIGGTFTDLVVINEETGEIQQEKVETNTQSPSTGVLNAIKKAGINPKDFSLFVHGTTLGLNALLERKGVVTGLITTQGFRDILEIGRLDRPHMYDILYRKPPVLIPRYLRKEVKERLDNHGNILTPLYKKSAQKAIRELKKQGVKAIAVSFLHSYANPVHELEMRELIKEEYPETYVSLSSDILQQFYEYERTVSASIDASIKPLMEKYLEGLEVALGKDKFSGSFHLTRTGGGAMTAREARHTPIHTVLSGPAGAIQGAVYFSQLSGYENLIVIDMGGTSFDVSLLFQGHPLVRTELEVGGHKILLPALDIQTIGAGGGSIAWVDDGRALQVGPQSAGADPGPICYGKGGTDPTVTDAAVCLGLIDPDYFLGGQITLNSSAARQAIERKIANPLRLSFPAACNGILTLIATKMTDVIRGITVERGFDPRDFSLLACGGGGPLFATLLASRMGILRVIVPRSPGNFSAWGMLMSDIIYDCSKTRPSLLDEIEIDTVVSIYNELQQSAQAALVRDKVPSSNQQFVSSLDMKYRMVGHSINVPLSPDILASRGVRESLHSKFEELHQLLYGYRLDDAVQVVNFRVRAIGQVRRPKIDPIPTGGVDSSSAIKGTRRIEADSRTKTDNYTIYRREDLRAGNHAHGPAIVEELSSTTVLYDTDLLEVDRFGNLVIHTQAER